MRKIHKVNAIARPPGQSAVQVAVSPGLKWAFQTKQPSRLASSVQHSAPSGFPAQGGSARIPDGRPASGAPAGGLPAAGAGGTGGTLAAAAGSPDSARFMSSRASL